jgi:hypothetical protein
MVKKLKSGSSVLNAVGQAGYMLPNPLIRFGIHSTVWNDKGSAPTFKHFLKNSMEKA